MNTDKLVYLGMLYGLNMPMMFYYCMETDEFYMRRRPTSPLEKVTDPNEIRKLSMRLQNIMEVG
jgi:hypothetical protein